MAIASTANKKIQLGNRANPYSIGNIKKANQSISTTNRGLNVSATNLPQYVYFKFNPNNITTEQFKALENDTTVRLLDFPFANIELYNEDFAFDEVKRQLLNDGNIYGITNIENTTALNVVASTNLATQFLDTLALIPEQDTTLQFEAYRQAGGTEEQIVALRLCLFKQPHGFVRYWDDELQNTTGGFGRLEPVRNMQVWGLVFGIPLTTYTDNNGHYNFPWRFSAGTIMGTHAKSSRVNVKPFNTTLGWAATAIAQAFIVGSVNVRGWIGACAMRSDVNFEYYGHTQVRYWCQLVNAYTWHDEYSANDQINNAPQHMVCYAQWANSKDIGLAGTPMLSQLPQNNQTNIILQSLFRFSIYGIVQNLLFGLLPDMSIEVSGLSAPFKFNSRLCQTLFHELGHAAMLKQVGNLWYGTLIWAEISHIYGAPDYPNFGVVQVAESWAEYIGTEYAKRRYSGFGVKYSVMLHNIVFCNNNTLETEDWFAEPANGGWIPCGIYYDLIDKQNTNPNNEDNWDKISGSTNAEMFNVFAPDVADMCEYRERFIQTYPAYNQNDIRTLFGHYSLNCK